MYLCIAMDIDESFQVLCYHNTLMFILLIIVQSYSLFIHIYNSTFLTFCKMIIHIAGIVITSLLQSLFIKIRLNLYP